MLESHMQARGELMKIRNQKREVQCMRAPSRSERQAVSWWDVDDDLTCLL